MEPLPPLSLHAYWEKAGTATVRQVCEQAGTSLAFYRLMAYYFKPCTPAMFERIEAAAKAVTGYAPDYVLCTRPALFARFAAERIARGDAKRKQWAATRATGPSAKA